VTDSRPALENYLPGDVPSLMLPFNDKVLLMPTVTVAEIVGYGQPAPIEGAPDWLLGKFRWRNQEVPMLSLELLSGQPLPDTSLYSRVAVLNHTGISDDLPFIAVPTVGIPKLERVTEDQLTMQDSEPANRFEKARVNLNGEDLVIPEIASLEQAYLDWERSC
jgi:chemosensory pili system protein ChpC